MDMLDDILTTKRFVLQLARMILSWFGMSHFAACFFAFVGTFGECPEVGGVDPDECERETKLNWCAAIAPTTLPAPTASNLAAPQLQPLACPCSP